MEDAALLGPPATRARGDDARRWARYVLASMPLLAILATVGLRSARRGGTPPGAELRTTEDLRITVMNEYAQLDALPAGTGYPWAEVTPIVEPWKITYLLVDGADAFSTYEWSILQASNVVAGSGDGVPHSSSGFDVSFVFENLGEYTLALKETPPAQYHLGEGRTTVRTLVCRYVRREIRRLSDKDRELYLDALHQISSLSAEAGRAKFGERFFNLDHFATLHLTLAGTREGDQLHDGLGFLTGMIALSASFERALQAVNPALALPYWDFTYDAASATNATNAGDDDDDTSGALSRAFFQSELWKEDIFGDHINGNHTVQSGRFAYQVVGTANASDSVSSPYGYLRAPWNVNKSPYVRREPSLCGASAFDFGEFPTCATHSALVLDTSYSRYGPDSRALGACPPRDSDSSASSQLVLVGLAGPVRAVPAGRRRPRRRRRVLGLARLALV